MSKILNRSLIVSGLICTGILSLGVVPPEELEATKPQLEVTQTGNNLILDWIAHPEVFYFMEGTPDLSAGSWVTAKLLKDNDASGTLTLGTAISGSKGFYRLDLEGDPDSARMRADDDGDGIINLLEVEADWDAYLTEDPTDSDSDGIPDYFEQFHFGTLDHDGTYVATAGGLTLAEAYANATDPNKIDSDGDGWTDKQEIAWGWSPNYDQSRDDPSYGPDGDKDGDGASNISESLNGTSPEDAEDTPYEPPSYAVIDLGPTSTVKQPMAVSNRGVVLLSDGEFGTTSAGRWSFEEGVEPLTSESGAYIIGMNTEGVVYGAVLNEGYDPYSAGGDETIAAYWPLSQNEAVLALNQTPENEFEPEVNFTNAQIMTMNSNEEFIGTRNTHFDTPYPTGMYFPVTWNGTTTDGFETINGPIAVRVVNRTYTESGNQDIWATIMDGKVHSPRDMNDSGNWIGSTYHYTAPADFNVYPDGSTNLYNPPNVYYQSYNGTELDFTPTKINAANVVIGHKDGTFGYWSSSIPFITKDDGGGAVGISSPEDNTEPLRLLTSKGIFQQKIDVNTNEYNALSAATDFTYWTCEELVNGRNATQATNWSNIEANAISDNGKFIAANATYTDPQTSLQKTHAVLLLKMDIDLHRPGTVGRDVIEDHSGGNTTITIEYPLQPEISEAEQQDPTRCPILINNDNDDLDSIFSGSGIVSPYPKDNDDDVLHLKDPRENSANPKIYDDDDVVMVTLRKFDAFNTGKIRLTTSKNEDVRFFKYEEDQYTLNEVDMADLEVDLSILGTTSPLKDLPTEDVSFYLEGINENSDLTVSMIFEDANDNELTRQEVHLEIIKPRIISLSAQANGEMPEYETRDENGLIIERGVREELSRLIQGANALLRDRDWLDADADVTVPVTFRLGQYFGRDTDPAHISWNHIASTGTQADDLERYMTDFDDGNGLNIYLVEEITNAGGFAGKNKGYMVLEVTSLYNTCAHEWLHAYGGSDLADANSDNHICIEHHLMVGKGCNQDLIDEANGSDVRESEKLFFMLYSEADE